MSDIKYTIIDGEAVPVLPAKSTIEIKHKRSGKKYSSKEEFHADVNDPNTDTTHEDLQEDVKITVASLEVFGKTK
tara:strand:+ start:178 stop:402 length:225 start_codon:yes stop_codon:yes gene_type:complete